MKMHLLIPLSKGDREAFRLCAIDIGFDEFIADKFLYTVHASDADVYQLMHDERISLLIYGWEICETHLHNTQNADGKTIVGCILSGSLKIVIKWLARFSVDLWLSREFDSCEFQMRKGLVYCLQRAEDILLSIPELSLVCWSNILKWDIHPWNNKYVNGFFNMSPKIRQTKELAIEDIEESASKVDIDYLREEDVLIIVMRLIKLVDGYNLEGAKQLSMRVLSAWNAVFERAKDIPGNNAPQIPTEFRRCIVSICHIYLMAIYEMDSNRGFLIDNMMNKIRFYYNSFLDKKFQKPLETIVGRLNFTPARFIALTCINLNISMHTFFQIFTRQGKEKNFTTFFGILSQSYISYILGNQLMEMNHMNHEHFNANIERYKSILNSYLEEREISELFLRDELNKQELQRNSHTKRLTIKNLANIENIFCKGNRSYNIVDCEKSSEDACASKGVETENGANRKTDAIFENMPNNEEILNYAYRMLAQRTYKGWYFAKIVLLLKIIGHEVNVIETWRYHPGLTTDFMLGLETKLSRHYEDLALIFYEHFFLEQEFWLTAFYLNPVRKYYKSLLRCGMRLQRRVQHADEEGDKHITSEPYEKSVKYAKYGLLSSTIDVTEILKIRNHETPNSDYDALNKCLSALKLSLRTVKDLITATFLPRNKSFSWALDWPELRKRCKKLLKYPEWKRRLVELNMAEANDRLKFLNVDYEKYKNRPQLDYGTIEEGYESVMHFTEREQEDGDSDDDIEDDIEIEEADFSSDHEDYEQVRGKEKRGLDAAKKNCEDLNQLVNLDSSGTRRTRSKTAAAMATAMLSEEERSKNVELLPKANEPLEMEKVAEIFSDPNNIHSSEELSCDASSTNVIKLNLQELLQERPISRNETFGFGSFPDIWEFDVSILRSVDKKYTENERLYQKLAFLKAATKSAVKVETLDEALGASDLDIFDVGTDLNKTTSQENYVNLLKTPRNQADRTNKEGTNETIVRQCYSECAIDEKYMLNGSAHTKNSFNTNDAAHTIDKDNLSIKDYTKNAVSALDGIQDLDENNRSQLATAQPEGSLKFSKKLDTCPAACLNAEVTSPTATNETNIPQNQENSQQSILATNVELTESNIKYEYESENQFGQDLPSLTERHQYDTITKNSAELVIVKKESQRERSLTFANNSEDDDCSAASKSNICEILNVEKNQFSEATSSGEQIHDNTIKGRSIKNSESVDILVTEGGLQEHKDEIDDNILSRSVNSPESRAINFPRKELVIRINRLKVTDCSNLRQPRVFINRIQNNTLAIASGEEFQSIDQQKCSEDPSKSQNSTSVPMSSSNTHQLRPQRRRIFKCSYSPSSTASDEEFMGPKSKRPQIKSQTMAKRKCKAVGHTKKMVVTPRSASGLKMCISSAPSGSISELSMPYPYDNIELIHISSSSSLEPFASSDDEIHPLAFVRPVPSNDLPDDINSNPLEDPLYEEEIILCDY